MLIAIFLACLVAGLVAVYLHDTRQTHHTILRNFPVIGHVRYFAETWGEYMRQYQYLPDWAERPFNRLERSWVYRSAKGVSNLVSFGSENVPSFVFRNAAFPVLDEEKKSYPGKLIGIASGPGACTHPYTARHFFNISGMSYGALSHAAVSALSKGAKLAGVWMSTGEGGLSSFHLEGGGDIIMQIGTAKYGVRLPDGEISEDRLREIAAYPQIKMFEVKLAQGAKPGKGGVLPGAKVTKEIAEIRGITQGQDSISPNRHRDIGNVTELGEFINKVRTITGKPVGVKFVVGDPRFIDEWFGDCFDHPEHCPDYVQVDGGEGGTGAAPAPLADYVGLPITQALPYVAALRYEHGLAGRIRIIASGKLITPDKVAWALCMGADFVSSARGFMFALGCIQAMKCASGNCPTGVTAVDPRLVAGLDPTDKSVRVAKYAQRVIDEVEMIAHSCGLTDATGFSPKHVTDIERGVGGFQGAFRRMMLYLLLFLLGAVLNILLGLHDWAFVLAGNLNDPDSYMRLLRIEQGIRAGHLVITVARDDSGAGVMVEWSRLLDMLLWLMAAPLSLFIGWHRALFAAGVALGPISVGVLGVCLAFAAEPFAARKYLWSAALAAAVLPGILTFAVPGVVHYHILLLALIALTAGCIARAWTNDPGYGFLGGVAGGFAIWLTPETMPFVLMAFATLMLRWLKARISGALLSCAAGFVDVLVVALFFDPPLGNFESLEVDRLSVVYVALALLLFIGAGLLWRLERSGGRMRRWGGVGIMAVLIIAWVAAFPKVAMGPYGIMSPQDMKRFFGVMTELQPVRGMQLLVFLSPGALAFCYALWRAAGYSFEGARKIDFNAMARPPLIQSAPDRGRLIWLYLAVCILVSLILGAKFILFVGFSAAAAAALLPVALSEASLAAETHPSRAMLSRIAILLAVFGIPQLAASAVPQDKAAASIGKTFPSCGLQNIAPLLAQASGKIVLAEAEYTPELLYRSNILTVGSLYQHGIPGYLRDRAAWRASPGTTEPPDVAATGATYILFCPTPSRFAQVADLPKNSTLWDALEAGHPPVWLSDAGTDDAGWKLFKISK